MGARLRPLAHLTIEKGRTFAGPAPSLLLRHLMCSTTQRLAVKWEASKRTAVSIHCKTWTCPECGPQRRRQLMAAGHGGNPRTFLTLTSKRVEGRTPSGAAAELARAWRLLRLRVMRHYKLKRLPFLAVFESTKLGWPHLHILLRAPFISQQWLSDQMADISGSPIVWIEQISNQGKIAAYVAKYCGKDPHRFTYSKRYWSSRDYALSKPPQRADRPVLGGGWEMDRMALDAWVSAFSLAGWHVIREGKRCAIAHAPP